MEIKDKPGSENLVAYHLSRMENLKPKEIPINDDFPYERLIAHMEYENTTEECPEVYNNNETTEEVEAVSTQISLQWYADYYNFLAARVLPPDLTYQQKKKLFHDLKHYYWDEPLIFKRGVDGIFH